MPRKKTDRLHWMPLDIPRYLADTGTLSTEENGAYMLLLAHIWMHKGRLRIRDDKEFRNLTKVDAAPWAGMREKILDMLTEIEPGVWTQKRLAEEYEHATQVSKVRQEVGKAGGEAKARNRTAAPPPPEEVPIGTAIGVPKGVATVYTETETSLTNVRGSVLRAGEGEGTADRDAVKTQERVTAAQKLRADRVPYPEDFEAAWRDYPECPNPNKAGAHRAWTTRQKQGHTVEEMHAGVRRYATYVTLSAVAPRYVKNPATFFGPDLHFTQPWHAKPALVPKSLSLNERRRLTMARMGTARNDPPPNEGADDADRSDRAIEVQTRVVGTDRS